MLYCNYDATTMTMIQYTDEDDGKRIKLITRPLGYKGQASVHFITRFQSQFVKYNQG